MFCRNSDIIKLSWHQPTSNPDILRGEMERADTLPQVFFLYLEHRLMSRSLLQSHIEIIHGHAAFTCDPEPTIEVNGKKYTAPHILIATGGVPSRPQESQIPGESSQGKYLLLTVKRSILLSSALYTVPGDLPVPGLSLGQGHMAMREGLCRT